MRKLSFTLTAWALIAVVPVSVASAELPGQAAAQAVAADVFPPTCAVVIEVAPLPATGPEAFATIEDCRVTFSDAYRWTEERVCTLMVHEYGHLAGRSHSDDPLSIMHGAAVAPWPACPEAEGRVVARAQLSSARTRLRALRVALKRRRECTRPWCRRTLRRLRRRVYDVEARALQLQDDLAFPVHSHL